MARPITRDNSVEYSAQLAAHIAENIASHDLSYDLTPEYCDDFLTTPVSPNLSCTSRDFPLVNDKPDQIFDFGSFEDWMAWDGSAIEQPLSPASAPFQELDNQFVHPQRTISSSNLTVYGGEPTSFEDDMLDDQLPTTMFEEAPENLYSTPLALSTPRMSLDPRPNNSQLTPEEEARLRAIAMPSLAAALKTRQGGRSVSRSSISLSSPEPSQKPSKPRKRVHPTDDDGEGEEEDEDVDFDTDFKGGKPPKKTAHNMIEKRYRTNLNDKIAVLRDSVPSLRVAKKGKGASEKSEDLHGLTPAHKLNKATVLSKATEYIAHLEKRTSTVEKDNAELRARIGSFEILIKNYRAQSYPSI
ncbi:helix-loop-helix DNA-binding domain-containing protein [Calycina marina]|uniref:Helix-loop-helix DNA-binding domain-containing protein n=1 Tax=Calycina marina TaxID=1763456 RepID=A0A9P7Z0B1_9HELO|nr:helix-loop-helix DNA-binding domain-containing protein [Calycina marina]